MNIGIVANDSPDDGRYWINRGYVDYFKTYGRVNLIDPLEQEVDRGIDLLVMPGGADVSPGRYGMVHLPSIGFPNRAYEVFDYFTLPKYIKARVPIFGICRGHQSLNVHFGGTLHPHVDEPTSYSEGMLAHYVGTYNKEKFFGTSSNHHQAVDKIGEGFKPLLWGFEIEKFKEEKTKSKPGKILQVEAMIHEVYPIATVQWHPEKNWMAQTHAIAERYTRDLIQSIL